MASSSSEQVSLVTVAQNLRTFAQNPELQPLVVRENTFVTGLTNLILTDNEEVLTISLQTLKFLSANPAARQPLATNDKILVRLAKLTDNDNQTVASLANECLNNLNTCINGNDKVKAVASSAPSVASSAPSTTSSTSSSSSSTSSAAAPAVVKRAFVQISTIVLYVKGLGTTKQATDIEHALISIKGVVSVNVQLIKNTVTVTVNCSQSEMVPLLTNALKGVGFEATLSSPELEKENQRTASSSISSSNNVPATPMKRGFLSANAATSSKALMPHGSVEQSTLANKQREQQAKVVQQQQQRSVLGAITSYFW